MKEYLYQIKRKIERLEEIELPYIGIQALPICERIQKSPDNIFEKRMIERSEVYLKAEKLKKSIQKDISKIDVRELTPLERNVIESYYFTNKTWTQISEETRISKRHLIRIAKKGAKKCKLKS